MALRRTPARRCGAPRHGVAPYTQSLMGKDYLRDKALAGRDTATSGAPQAYVIDTLAQAAATLARDPESNVRTLAALVLDSGLAVRPGLRNAMQRRYPLLASM